MLSKIEIEAAIEAARLESHANVDRCFDALRERLLPAHNHVTTGAIIYKEPTEEDCRDPRNKFGKNLSPEGVEVLFRLLDGGAGYNTASRKMSVTQTAVKNRKKDWEAAGGLMRDRHFISYLDRIA
ncbi:hypothetical protein [Rhizobium sp. M1]|uniref:hypothetical protein n=1 Tax=Rhizobium sp. M1 TaxID=2035453 RepID=UPI000BE79234|nr:hypothetical protein [Rhizobium sp. M1]PDT06859.1 hypothetical protein CO655_30490 [Rhizobium sp. M1]